MSNHKFNYKWKLSDGYPANGINKNGLNVFGTFICGGGSTMGYKLAGYNHLGGVDIDKEVSDIYKANHNPKYLFVEDIRIFSERNNYPDDLYELDILDGSPPCTSFSTAGYRDKLWGTEKEFREGQVKQRLDDLFYDYIKLAKKLQPKVIVAENVKGMLQGNAKNYVKNIKQEFNNAGYNVQIFLLNAASMGVPQKRERVFFICNRMDLKYKKLKLEFNEKPITYGQLRMPNVNDMPFIKYDFDIWKQRKEGDRDYAYIFLRTIGKRTNWGSRFVYDDEVCPTIVSSPGGKLISTAEPKHLCNDEMKMCGTFPLDFNFKDMRPKYLIGMSVPPIMIAQIAHQIYLQWFKE